MALLTFAHVLVSLFGILSGIIVAIGLLANLPLVRPTALFLGSTLLTSLSGFLFPVHRFMPSHAAGILSLVVLAFALNARYVHKLADRWRTVYVVTAVTALYLNVFVLIAQLFQKVPALEALAPTQSEPPFLGAQALALALFVALGVAAVRRFKAPMESAHYPRGR